MSYSLSVSNIVISSLVVFSLSGAILYLVKQRKKRNYVRVAKVSKLIIYPVKSLPGIEVNEAIVTKSGLKFGPFNDRTWMLVSDQNRFITQRTENSLALLKPSFHTNELWIDGPNLPTLKLKIRNKKESKDVIIKTKVWGDLIEGIYCSIEAEEWFSSYLGKPGTKLIEHIPQLAMRSSGAERNGDMTKLAQFPIRFQDGSGLLVINESSVKDLNDKLVDQNRVSYKHFRPNILISDCEPFEEDGWVYVNINGINFTFLKPCDRCVLTTIDPNTGIKNESSEPLQTLRTYRLPNEKMKRFYGTSPLFGVNWGPENEGIISCGSQISAVRRSS